MFSIMINAPNNLKGSPYNSSCTGPQQRQLKKTEYFVIKSRTAFYFKFRPILQKKKMLHEKKIPMKEDTVLPLVNFTIKSNHSKNK